MKKLFLFTIFTLSFGQLVIFSQDKESKNPEPVKPALVIIDIQNQFLAGIPEQDKKIAFYYINSYISIFRKKNLPIIRVYHTDPGWGPHPDSSGFQYPEEIQALPDDPMVVKNYANSFKKTDLHKILQEEKCNTLLLCGLSAVGCVIATYFGAKDLDYKTFMLKDAIMSHDSAYTGYIEEIFGAIGYDVASFILEQAKRD
jgi:nicotinamidase-related amidase